MKNKKNNAAIEKINTKYFKVISITIILGLIVGFFLIGTEISHNKMLIFQYLNFLLTVCVLALLIDIKKDLKQK